MHRDFAHINTWIFDLDETLYPPEIDLFDQIHVKMRDYVMNYLGVTRAEADEIRGRYWREHGTTLAGMMKLHDMPADDFLRDVHDIDLSNVHADPELYQMIGALPGRKLIFTNGSHAHGVQVSKALGIFDLFEAIYSIEDTDLIPKPNRAAFDRIIKIAEIDPTTSTMFEDHDKNLVVPHALGMRTVLVHQNASTEIQPDLHAGNVQDALRFIHGERIAAA